MFAAACGSLIQNVIFSFVPPFKPILSDLLNSVEWALIANSFSTRTARIKYLYPNDYVHSDYCFTHSVMQIASCMHTNLNSSPL